MASNASGLTSTNALKTNMAPNFFSLISIPLDIIALKILNNIVLIKVIDLVCLIKLIGISKIISFPIIFSFAY